MPSSTANAQPSRKIERITIVGTLPPLCAISSYCEGLALALVKHAKVEFISFRALYPRFLYPGGSLEDDHAREPVAEGLQIKRTLTWYNPFSWLAAGLRLKGEVVNLQWWSTPLFPILATIAALCRIRGIPVVTTIHNVVPHGGKSSLFLVMNRLLYAMSDKVVVHSQDNAEQAIALYGISPQKVLISKMGMADFAQGRSTDREQARSRLRLPWDKRILLMFGGVREYKGFDTALAAMPSIAAEVDDVLLLIAGQPWQLQPTHLRLLDEAAKSDHVRLDMRYIPETEVHDYLSAADIVLLPYKPFAAQSGAGISALAYGHPMIVTATGSLPELVRDEDSVIPVGDSARLAGRIVEILNSRELYEKLGQDSELIARDHTWDRISQGLYDAFAMLPTTGRHRLKK